MRHSFFVGLLIFWSLCILPACSEDDTDARSDGDEDGDSQDRVDGDDTDDTPSDGDLEDGDAAEDEDEEELNRWGFSVDHPLFQSGLLAIAHRGGGLLAPEESMEAYEHAVSVGVDMLEMDLHATSDGVLVLHHDATVDRITDGTGAIKEMTFAELQALDAGYAFTPDDGESYPYRGQGVQITTFQEVLERFPEMIFSAEIKQNEPSIVDAMLEVLQETNMEDRVILVSFNDNIVEEIRQKNPRIVTGAGAGEMARFNLLTEDSLAEYEPPCPIFQLSAIEAKQMEWARTLGIQVQVWTINEAEEMRSLIQLGVDGIMTDNPDLLESILEEESTGR